MLLAGPTGEGVDDRTVHGTVQAFRGVLESVPYSYQMNSPATILKPAVVLWRCAFMDQEQRDANQRFWSMSMTYEVIDAFI